MSLFCLFWLPVFYLFWRVISGNNVFSGGVWALLAGSIVAMLQFFLGFIVEPEGFGSSKWINGFVDVIALPVLLPLLVYLLLVVSKVVSGNVDFIGFTLLWLIPGGAMRALSWSALGDPVHLVLVPFLWTVIAVGVPFLFGLFRYRKAVMIIIAFIGALVVPVAATSAYWAFYAQKTFLGFLFFAAAAIPTIAAVFFAYTKADE